MRTLATLCATAALAVTLTGTAQAELTQKEQSIIPIAALTAQGNEPALRRMLNQGLDNGLTVNEIKAVLEQMYAYTGFPRSLTALNVFVKVLEDRKAEGKKTVVGKEPSPLPKGKTIRELGTATQTELVGRPVTGAVYEFSPNIDTYLKEHLFGDIFANDVLNYRQRELATVAALAALPAPAQLRSHLNVCLNVGLTPEELQEFVDVMKFKVADKSHTLARNTVKAVLEARQQKK